MYEISTTKKEVTKDWKRQRFVMIGHSGIGKSTFWSYADDVGYLDSEGGLNFIENIMVNPVRDFKDTIGCLDSLLRLRQQGKFPYKLFVVDTIDKIVDYAEEDVLNWAREKFPKSEINDIRDIADGRMGWGLRRSKILQVLDRLNKLPCAKVIISHLESKRMKEDGREFDKDTISIGGNIGNDILSWSDHTLHVKGIMMGDVLKRTVYTKPTKSREAKSRGGVIKDGWVWVDSDQENFKKLREQFT